MPAEPAVALRQAWSAPVLRPIPLRDAQGINFSLSSVDGTSTS
jgi:hypothetical protein